MAKTLDVPASPRRRLKVNGESVEAVEIYPRCVLIQAVKHDGRTYQHDFTGDEKIYGLPNGDLLIRGRSRLWRQD